MRRVSILSACAVMLIAGTLAAAAQNPPAPAPAQPYKAVALSLPAPMADPALDAARRQIG